MKWTGGAKESLSKKGTSNSDRHASLFGRRPTGNDVFFNAGASCDNEQNATNKRKLSTSSAARRIQTNLASISEWSQAAGLSVLDSLGPILPEPQRPTQTGAASRENSAGLTLKTKSLALPSISMRGLVSPDTLMQSTAALHQLSTVAVTTGGIENGASNVGDGTTKLQLRKVFQIKRVEEGAEDFRKVDPGSAISKETSMEPLNMEPPPSSSHGTPNKAPTTSEDRKRLTHLQITRFNPGVLHEPIQTNKQAIPEVQKRDAIDESLRVKLSPGKTAFFATLDPPAKKHRQALQPVLYWNEGRQTELVGDYAQIRDPI